MTKLYDLKIFSLTIFLGLVLLTGQKMTAQDVYCANVDHNFVEEESGKVSFSSTSDKPVLEWYWYFGDQATSREENPTHQYAFAGTYEVCLKVLAQDNCTGAQCKTIRVETGALGGSCNLDVQWKYDIAEKLLTAKGWSNANNASRYVWSFGDDTQGEGTEVRHEYSKDGQYEVCLTVTQPSSTANGQTCTERSCKKIIIGKSQNPCDLKADIAFEVSGNWLGAKAISNAGNTGKYIWKISDGTVLEGPEIKHEFKEKGDYEICLNVTRPATNAAGSCTVTVCKKVSVGTNNSPCDFDVDFKFEVNGNILAALAVTNAGNGANYKWKISDGTVLEGQEIKHEFKERGDYEICLHVVKPATTASQICQKTVCKKVSVGTNNSPCDFDVDFKFEVNENILAAIAVSNAGAGAKYRWKISDGTTLEGQEIKHEFKERGDYEICLLVVKPATTASQICQKTVCKKVSVGQIINGDCPLQADFRITRSNTALSLQAKSNDPEAEYTWTIEGQNATYSGREVRIPISNPGVYTICLTVVSRRWECRIKICKRVVVGRSNGIISPNPATDYIRIFSADQNISSYILINEANGLMASQKLLATETFIDVTHLPTGMYFLQVEYEDGTTSIEKIFKQ